MSVHTSGACRGKAHAVTHAVRLTLIGSALLGAVNGGMAQEIAEITVTARKVEESLKDVPLAITAFDSDAIEAAAITSLGDIADLTPGLTFFNAFGEDLPVPVIRGIVPQDIFGVNAVAIFVDGVYVSGREGLNFSQLDLERIEVVKGPQSALYGRNAFNGAINYITKRPSPFFESRTEAEVGNRGKVRGLGMVSGPILTDALRGRLSVLYDEWDGSYDNSWAPENDIGGYRYRSYQGRLEWLPADNLTVSAGLYYSNDEIDDAAMASLPANCEDRIEFGTDVNTRPLPRLQNFCGKVPKLKDLPNITDDDAIPKVAEALGESRDLVRANFNVEWELADLGTLSFLTGYSNTEQEHLFDHSRSTGEELPLIYCPEVQPDSLSVLVRCTSSARERFFTGWYFRGTGEHTEEWSQEIRFTSRQDQPLRFVAGAYYFNVTLENYPGGFISTRPLPAPLTQIGLGPFLTRGASAAIGTYIFGATVAPDGGLDPLGRIEEEQNTDAWALFTGIDFDLTDALTARFELRYNHESQDAEAFRYKRCGPSNLYVFPGHEFVPDVDPGEEACGDQFWDLRVTQPCLDPEAFVCTPGTETSAARFESVTGRFGLDYKLNSDWLVYASVARGEKPGGFELVEGEIITDTGTPEAFILVHPFLEEKITAYELGIKGVTADRRVDFDLALFFNDWKDIVLRHLTETHPEDPDLQLQDPISLSVNTGDARVWGWEMQTGVNITENLTGRVTLAYTDSELTNARQDSFALFPSFWSQDPRCNPPESLDPQTARACQLMAGDVSGNTQMRQPEWTASASLSYERPLFGAWSWFARLDANYKDKIYVGNDNQSFLPSQTFVNLRIGADSPRFSIEAWVRNLFEEDSATAAFRDIYWTNDDDVSAPFDDVPISSFDDFPPLRLSVSYPRLRTFGIAAKMRFGGAVE
jgi:iron complex outermembrane receptor protein